MNLNLESKTIQGLIGILALSCIMVVCGKLTPELVEVIKWVGTSFMAVRGVANYAEGKKP